MVLDTLHVLGERFEAKRVARPAVAYLLSEMEAGGLWRFYGRHQVLPYDLDSTAVTLRALGRWGEPVDYVAAAKLIESQRDAGGRFYTWVLDQSSPLRSLLVDPRSFLLRLLGEPRSLFRRRPNVIDPVVNANVFGFLASVGLAAPETERFLVARAQDTGALDGSGYYVHPECFAYALSKACELTGSSHALRVATAAFVERLTRARSLEWDTPPFLTIRLAAASLRLPGGAVDLSRTAEVLVGLQRPDGSWPWGEAWAAAVWPAGTSRPLYGSPALDVALALEALGRCATS